MDARSGGRGSNRGRSRVERALTVLASVPGAAAGRPARALIIALALAVLAVPAAAGMRSGSSAGLLVDSDSGIARATAAQERAFGSEPILISVEGELGNVILAPGNLLSLLGLEGRVAQLDGVAAVYGPGTFVNQTIVQVERLLEREIGPVLAAAGDAAAKARRAALRQGATRLAAVRSGERARLAELGPLRAELGELLTRFGYVGLPSLTNRSFVSALVFGATAEPKERFRWLFPDAGHAVIVVRPQAGLTDDELAELGKEVEELVGRTELRGVRTTVAGAPLVAAAVGAEIGTELLILAPVVALGIGIMLLIGLRSLGAAIRCLLLAGFAALLTAGLCGLLGLGLTAATVAALPVVLGLTVDFAVQLVTRAAALRATGEHANAAALLAIRSLAPVLSLAAVAMSVGFMVLTLSPIPLVDALGQTLALGTLVGLGVVLALGAVSPIAGGRADGSRPLAGLPGRLRDPRAGRAALIAAGILAVAGIAVSGQARVESDLSELAPPGLEELERAEAVQEQLGTSGQLRVAIAADRVTEPGTLVWLSDAQASILALGEGLRPGPNLAELLLAGTGGQTPTRADVDTLLAVLPEYFVSAVLSADRRQAELSFGVPLMPVAEQAELFERIGPILERAPEGVSAAPAGLLAAAAEGVTALEGGRPWLLLAALACVFAVILLARRDPWRAVLPILPAVLAAGISSLVIFVLGFELSPLSAGLEPLVLAVGTEFGLLLEARYRELRARGLDPAAARRRAVDSVGAAVAISALAVGVGFAALAASRLELLREFGLLVGFELALCFLAALLVVPGLAAWRDARAARVGPSVRRGQASRGPQVDSLRGESI